MKLSKKYGVKFSTLTAIRAVEVAQKHCWRNSSAKLCVEDAVECITNGKDEHALERAIDSLEHSKGTGWTERWLKKEIQLHEFWA